MILLLLGLALWIAAHLFKSAAPDVRARFGLRFGPGASKGIFAVAITLGLLLVIFGYRAAPYVAVWTPPTWTVHLNNLLMLIAVAAFGMGKSKGRARTWLRHPMLMSVVIWAAAHLLVNGDLAAIVMFGGFGLWAVVNMVTINARDGAWIRPEPGPLKGDVRLIFITLAAYILITGAHAGLGVWPFAG